MWMTRTSGLMRSTKWSFSMLFWKEINGKHEILAKFAQGGLDEEEDDSFWASTHGK